MGNYTKDFESFINKTSGRNSKKLNESVGSSKWKNFKLPSNISIPKKTIDQVLDEIVDLVEDTIKNKKGLKLEGTNISLSSQAYYNLGLVNKNLLHDTPNNDGYSMFEMLLGKGIEMLDDVANLAKEELKHENDPSMRKYWEWQIQNYTNRGQDYWCVLTW